MKLLSKNKYRLLKLFYGHPEEEFYIQEIGRRLGKKPGVFQRALDDLDKDGLLLSHYKANARFFRLNKSSPIFNELKGIISKTAKLAVIVVLSCAPLLYANGPQLNLKDAILTAFKNNKDLKMQEEEVAVAAANIVDARSAFLPKLNFEAAYTRNEKVFVENIFTGYKNDNLMGFALSESLFSGGANLSALRQAQIGLNVRKETLRAKKLEVEFEIKRLYYGLLLAFENERIAREALGRAKAHYADVKHKFNQGAASRFDVLQSGVQVSLLEPPLVKARNEVKLIKAELNKAMGLKIDEPIEASEELTCRFFTITEEEFLKTAYLHKPEMALKALGIDINKWAIALAKSGYRPQVNLAANYSFRSNDLGSIFEAKQSNWNAGVAFNIPIFEGFSVKAKVDEAKARYAEAVVDKENLSDQIAVDIRQDCLNLKESAAIIQSQKDHVGEAREALRIAEVSYDNGVAKNLDVLDAQVSLVQIQTNLASAIYDYLMAEASLKRNMGESYVREEKDEEKN
ncbi:MAG: TolC family protein [Candidatus Omnitrophota bacterium]